MSEANMLRAAANVLLRKRCTVWNCEHARAMADVLTHEARWAESDPEYACRPEQVPVVAARLVLGRPARLPR